MKEGSNHRSNWKAMFIILTTLIGGFLLSFLGFGLLWSGIAWHVQLIMMLPFLLLSYGVFRWSKGSIGSCAFIFIGAAPLGILISQFRDTNGSHLMPILVVFSWVIGILAGYYWGKLSRSTQSKSSEIDASS
ncbi:lysophosphatidic acid receptor [Nitrosomonas sp.]|uniref:lysophosphatidic acid receptor n=1 Tax=Nitrosomonas sp. TaxID=42353 RepID=UPI0025E7710F|nr:lysophosphatidic acid receptor [Nitrosomonas sp.]